MQTSVKLENMEKHFNDILELINQSQKIKRYLCYNSNNPLKNSTEQPDITKSLIGDNIQLSFFNENIISEPKCFLFFNLLNSDLSKETIGEETYVFDIVTHNNLWRLQGLGQFRAIRIGMELCSMLDQQHEIAGLGKIIMKKAHCGKVNNDFQYMELVMSVSTSNRCI